MRKRKMLVLMALLIIPFIKLNNNAQQPTPIVSPKEEIEVVKHENNLEESILKEEQIRPKTVTISRGSVIVVPQKFNQDDVILLAKLIQSEALDEPYEGKVAVGSVVINRMKDKNSTMKDVIYAKYQFSGVNGRLFNQEPSEDCIKAAKESLAEVKPVGQALYFVDLTVVNPSWTREMIFVKRIGNHWFYKKSK